MADHVGWFHLRVVDGALELVGSAMEMRAGYRLEVDPNGWPMSEGGIVNPSVDQWWTDPDTGIRWRYTNHDTYCGIGAGWFDGAAVESSQATTTLVIPQMINGLPVRQIESYAFSQCYQVRRIVVPNSITNFAAYALGDSGIEQIDISSDNAFFQSKNGLLLSADGAELIAVPPRLPISTLPDGITTIGVTALAGCKSISNLALPPSVKRIRSRAFEMTRINYLDFEGNAPTLDDDAMSGANESMLVRSKVGTTGWTNDLQWQGFQFTPRAVRTESDEKFDLERTAEDGSEWIDTIDGCHFIHQEAHTTTSRNWVRQDYEFWETNVTTRQVSPDQSDIQHVSYEKWENEIKYWDLEHIRTYRLRKGRTDYHSETSKAWVLNERYMECDEHGNRVLETSTVEYYDDEMPTNGLVRQTESRTFKYAENRLAWEKRETTCEFADGSTSKENRYLTFSYDSDGRLSTRQEQVNATEADGSHRRERHTTEIEYRNGQVQLIERKNEVTRNGVCRWDNQNDWYDKEGRLCKCMADSGLVPEGMSTLTWKTEFGPGASWDVDASSETEAFAQVGFLYEPPVGSNGTISVAIQDYRGYFKTTATETSANRWRIDFDIDAEAISLDQSVKELGMQLCEIANGTTDAITLPCKPGLYYGIGYSENPNGSYACDKFVLAEGTTISLPAPPHRSRLFMRILVRTKE